jgi:FkbH-like protein
MNEPSLQPWELGAVPLHRLLLAGRRVPREACHGTVRAAVLGDAATQHYCQALGATLKLRGWWPDIYEAEFDTIRQEVLDRGSGLYAHAPRVVILFTCVQTFARRMAAATARASVADEYVDELRDVWNQIGRGLPATVIQHNLAMPVDRPYGNQTPTVRDSLATAVAHVNARLREEVGRHRVRLVDTEFQSSYFGKHHWFDERLWCQAKQALSPAFLPPLAKSVSDTLLAEFGVGIKCVIVDLDNTLWGGILADDGMQDLEIGQTELGLVYLRIQQFLAQLRDRGVLLAICSKNDEGAVYEMLENHPDMVLRRQDFAIVVANYQDKVANILAIRERLNIGLDSLVFLDDSAFEREMVRRALPEIQVPELPDDPARVLDSLARWNLFEGHASTDEDRARPAQYQAEREREALRERHEDVDHYLADLNMEASPTRFDSYTLPRILQLVQRSNQFNLTTIRYSESELAAIAVDPETSPLAIRLVDRLGDYGIVVAVVLRVVGRDLIVDTWIMSCRVLGRRVEQLTLSLIVDRARAAGCRRVIGRFTPTAKNSLVADHYSRLGFAANGLDGDTQLFRLDVDQFTRPELPIRILESTPQESS